MTEIMKLLDKFAKAVASELHSRDNETFQVASNNLGELTLRVQRSPTNR